MSSKRYAKRRKKFLASADATAPDDASRNVWPERIIGGKYIRMLEQALAPLRHEDSKHGNCSLFLDDVFVMYLLAFFNPTIRTLRTIEDLSQTQQVQRHLKVARVCKSTLSDFNRLVDPDRLLPIIKALQAQQPSSQGVSQSSQHLAAADPDLRLMLEKTIAVDGTFLHAVADVAWAVANSNNHGATRHRARLDAHLNVTTWLPETIVVPDPGQSEANSAIEHIQADRIYIYDRGYASFALIRAHYRKTVGALNRRATGEDQHVKSHFVIRYKQTGKNSSSLKDDVEQSLTDEDREAGVTSDRIGYFISDSAKRAGVCGIKLREVIVPYEEKGKPKVLRIITNLLDVSAKTIALLYQFRWQVELFFRWFKSFGNFGHLISHSRSGVLSHLYVSIIAILLTYLHTGHRPSKYMFAMLGQVAAGAATLDEVIPILHERERRSELDRQSAARRREKLKNAST